MHPKELESVFNLEPHKRYEYFIKKVVDFEEVWGLKQDSGWVTTADDNGKVYIPFWPKKDFAELCIKDEWNECYAELISLDKFINSWLPGMNKDKVMASIFPTFIKNSVIIEPKKLLEHLSEELELYD
jgi:hypothetical protein